MVVWAGVRDEHIKSSIESSQHIVVVLYMSVYQCETEITEDSSVGRGEVPRQNSGDCSL